MLDRFKEVIESEFAFIQNSNLFLAISGGKDSMVLSRLLLESGIQHRLLHCNFKLRGAESDADEKFLLDYAKQNSLKIDVAHFDTASKAEKWNLSIQETARNLRYTWFSEFMDDHSYLLTAHHLDDSIETFFINLMRGTGLKGLSGIPMINERIIRPLSRFTSEDIYKYIDEKDLEYRKDSSNDSNKYLRNRIRNTIIPQMLESSPELKIKMRSLMTDLKESSAFIEGKAQEFKKEHFQKKDGNIYANIGKVSIENTLFQIYLFKEFNIHRSHMTAWEKFLKSSTGSIFHSDSHDFLIDREDLIISLKETKDLEIDLLIDHVPFQFEYESLKLKIDQEGFKELSKNSKLQQLDFSKIQFPLRLRKWKKGDKIQALGMKGNKLISDILIDKKINQFDKNKVFVLEEANEIICCLIGLVIGEQFKVTSSTKDIILVQS